MPRFEITITANFADENDARQSIMELNDFNSSAGVQIESIVPTKKKKKKLVIQEPNGFVFLEYEDTYFVCSKEYWNEHLHAPDSAVEVPPLPSGFSKSSETGFKYSGPDDPKDLLKAAGFLEAIWRQPV